MYCLTVSILTRRKLAEEVQEYWQYYTGQLDKHFQAATRYEKIYLNALKDLRLPHEKWRAFTPMPYAWSAIQSLASSSIELIFSIDPAVQPTAVGAEDEELEQKIERLFDYQFRKIGFRNAVLQTRIETLVHGTSIRKNTLIEQSRDVLHFPSQAAVQEFQAAVAAAVQEGVQIPDFNDPVAFEQWRQQALATGIPIPEMPLPGPKRILRYKGPGFLYVSLFDMRFDPHLEPDEQVCIIQRTIKPQQWVLDRTGPDGLFDAEAVDAALKGGPSFEDLQRTERQLADAYDLMTQEIQTDPRMKNAAELWEAWMPGAENNYRVILNRSVAINTRLTNPYAHGSHPYLFFRNHAKPGRATGLSELKAVERLFYELTSFRGLRLDALLLSVLPVFVKARDAGLGDLIREFVPGALISTSRPEAVTKLSIPGPDPAIFQEINEIKGDIDDAMGSLGPVRGQVAAPRVAASAVERAFNATFARIKSRVIEFEDQLTPFVENSLFIFYQFMPAEWRVRVGGDPRMNAFLTYRTEDFLEAIQMDFAFRGGTTAINREQDIAMLREWFTVLANAQLPEFKATEMARYITDRVTRQKASQFFRSEEEMAAIARQQQEVLQPQEQTNAQ